MGEEISDFQVYHFNRAERNNPEWRWPEWVGPYSPEALNFPDIQGGDYLDFVPLGIAVLRSGFPCSGFYDNDTVYIYRDTDPYSAIQITHSSVDIPRAFENKDFRVNFQEGVVSAFQVSQLPKEAHVKRFLLCLQARDFKGSLGVLVTREELLSEEGPELFLQIVSFDRLEVQAVSGKEPVHGEKRHPLTQGEGVFGQEICGFLRALTRHLKAEDWARYLEELQQMLSAKLFPQRELVEMSLEKMNFHGVDKVFTRMEGDKVQVGCLIGRQEFLIYLEK